MSSGLATHKQPVLGALNTGLGLEERKTNKKTSCDVGAKLCQDIGRISPMRLCVTLQQGPHLVGPRGRELASHTSPHRPPALFSFSVYGVQFLLQILGFPRP